MYTPNDYPMQRSRQQKKSIPATPAADRQPANTALSLPAVDVHQLLKERPVGETLPAVRSNPAQFVLSKEEEKGAAVLQGKFVVQPGVVQRVVGANLPWYTVVVVNSGPNKGRQVRILMNYTNPGNEQQKGYFTADVLTDHQAPYLYDQLDPVGSPVATPVPTTATTEETEMDTGEEGAKKEGVEDPVAALLSEQGDEWVTPGKPMVDLVMKDTGAALSALKVTTSGGLSLTVIPPAGPVYQYFKGSTFRTIQEVAERSARGGERLRKHIAGIVKLVPELNVAVFDRITPLNQIFDMFGAGDGRPGPTELKSFIRKNANKLAWDIGNAIGLLAKEGIAQSDVSIDNIGIKDGQFVLFDFDKAKGSEGSDDMSSLFTSISKRGEIPPTRLADTRQRIEKHLQEMDPSGASPGAAPFLKLGITMPEGLT